MTPPRDIHSMGSSEATPGSIDRRTVVARHDIRLHDPQGVDALTLGNGDFAVTVDRTGMQTFTQHHDPSAAEAEGRSTLNTATLSTWGWHEMPSREKYTLADASTSYPTSRGPVAYPDKFDMETMAGKTPADEFRAGTWLHVNPQRLDLGRVGLTLRPSKGADPETDPRIATDSEQHLDLWTGVLTSKFSYLGERVEVTTVAAPDAATVSFRIQSPLIPQGLLGVMLSYPYPSDGFFQTSRWDRADQHQTDLMNVTGTSASIRRTVDSTEYLIEARWSKGEITPTADRHHLHISGGDNVLELTVRYSLERDGQTEPLPDFVQVLETSKTGWESFWLSGAAIDLGLTDDPRAHELERRIVLSQYLTRVNCSGQMPPQETGLVTNSWQGKSHLEMHWWHGAHFPAWGRPELLERSFPWYESIADAARQTAALQRYRGLRWPKHVGPDGRESPSHIGALLVWQQPHLMYMLELAFQVRRGTDDPAGSLLVERYATLVEDAAEFMVDFVERREDGFHLPAPIMPAQEFYDARTTEDPTFELAYWWWGLEIAQRWRERRGEQRNATWTQVMDGLVRPRTDDGSYAAVGNAPLDRLDDHPSMLAALGLVPPTPLIDSEPMARTLQYVLDRWNWDTTWGWDYPMVAMTAARLNRPDIAIDALLMDTAKNQFLVNGHNPQMGNRLPIYLPGNGGVLSATARMIAPGKGSRLAGFPDEWTVRHEGFPSLP